MSHDFPYKTIGQHDNANDAMFAVLHALVGNPNARKKTRQILGSMQIESTGEWIDTNIVHDMIKAYNSAKAERASRPECVR